LIAVGERVVAVDALIIVRRLPDRREQTDERLTEHA
jgi:hypothetical protein